MGRKRNQPITINGTRHIYCTNCGMLKPESSFSDRTSKTGAHGKNSWCKVCCREWAHTKRVMAVQKEYNIPALQAEQLVAKRRAITINSGVNICFDCKNACGGCSWTEVDQSKKEKPIRFQPVDGWTATPIINGGEITGYHITACPEFVPDERRNEWKD